MNAWRAGGPLGPQRPGLKCGGNGVDGWWQRGCTPLAIPFHVPWSPYHWPANLTELPAPVAMATGAHREMSQLVWDKIFPFPQATWCLSFSFVYVLLPATSLAACTSCHDLFEVYVSASPLNKNSAWNKWCNCLHGQKCVYSLTGSLALSLRARLIYVSTQECTEELSCHELE